MHVHKRLLNHPRASFLVSTSRKGATCVRNPAHTRHAHQPSTRERTHSDHRFLGNLVLNLWDCGGQEAFMENYLESQKDHIFSNVAVLIYVFDVVSKDSARYANTDPHNVPSRYTLHHTYHTYGPPWSWRPHGCLLTNG